MTTVDPGASEVFTHGLRSRPRSTALRASSPAPIITDGFDVLVQLVIAAITTRPWSSSTSSPSSSFTMIGSASCSAIAARLSPSPRGSNTRGRPASPSWSSAGGSEAGNDSSIASSRELPSASAASGSNSARDSMNAGFASASAILSWGRFGPAIDGSTLPRSKSSVSVKVGSSELSS